MRPICLTMTAFGPFPGTEQVDFEKFGDAPLFLINGPTGSGKTTILDAICFALYGQTTGDEREGSQMRCDLSSSDTLAEVVLTFELGDQRYRIRRVPEQQRPKARGEGTTTHSTEAQFWSLGSDGEEQLIVARKVKDATAEIENRTGLNADQFRQVMVLPQGKFRQLLMADSKDREQIFGQLFQTQVYKKLEDSLKTQSSEIRREVEKSRQVQVGMLESAGLDSLQALTAELEDLQPQWQNADKLKASKNELFLAANKQLHEARTLQTSFEHLAKAETQLRELAAKKGEFDNKRTQRQQAEQAQKLKPGFDHLDRSEAELASAKQKLIDAGNQQVTRKAEFDLAEQALKTADASRAQLDDAKQQLNTLNSYHERGEQLSRSRLALQQAEKDEGLARSNVQQADTALKAVLSKREEAEGQQQTIQQTLTGLADKQLELKQLADQLADKTVLQGLQDQVLKGQQKLDRAKQQGQQLASEHGEAEKKTKTLELAWHQGQAAILAQDLNAGQPCPVCGSSEHPSPAHSEQALPTQAQLEQAKDNQQQALNKLTGARENYASLNSHLEGLQTQRDEAAAKLGEAINLTEPQLRQQHETLTQEVAQLLDQQRQLGKLDKRLGEFKANEEQARKRFDTATNAVAQAGKQLAATKSQALNAEQELPEAYRETGALHKAIAQVQNTVKELEQQINQAQDRYKQSSAAWEAAKATEQAALETQKKAEKAAQLANEAWSSALQASCFESQQDYVKAGLRYFLRQCFMLLSYNNKLTIMIVTVTE